MIPPVYAFWFSFTKAFMKSLHFRHPSPLFSCALPPLSLHPSTSPPPKLILSFNG